MHISFSLRISDENLNFEMLENKLGISHTKVIKKGQLVLVDKKSSQDVWIYKKKAKSVGNLSESLISFLNEILPHSEYLKEIKETYDEVNLSCFLRSDFGQMGFELTADTIKLLEKLNLSIDFHILSFGLVEE